MLKTLLALIFILKTEGFRSYHKAYQVNSTLAFMFGSTEDKKITCDNHFTKCLVMGTLMMHNSASNQFQIIQSNPCIQSQVSRDFKLHLCRTSASTTPGTYSVIINPELNFTSVQTITSTGRIIMSADGQWLVDLKQPNNQMQIYKWNDQIGQYQSSQNISAQGPVNRTILKRLFTPNNNEYLLTYQKDPTSNACIDLFVNEAGIFAYKKSYIFQAPTSTTISPIYIILSDDGSLILYATNLYVVLFRYQKSDCSIRMVSYQEKLIDNIYTTIHQIVANKDLDFFIESKRLDNSIYMYKKAKNDYSYTLSSKFQGQNQPVTSYVNYESTWIIRSSKNGTFVFYVLCQIPGCAKCKTPNVCQLCINQSNIVFSQQNGINITSCQCNQNLQTMSQTLNQCVQCKVEHCRRCDQTGLCAFYDFQSNPQTKLNTIETVLFALILFLIFAILVIMITFIVCVMRKLKKQISVHPNTVSKEFSDKLGFGDKNLTIQNFQQHQNNLQHDTKMHIQKDPSSNFIAQVDQSQHFQSLHKVELINENSIFKHDKKGRRRFNIREIDAINYDNYQNQDKN